MRYNESAIEGDSGTDLADGQSSDPITGKLANRGVFYVTATASRNLKTLVEFREAGETEYVHQFPDRIDKDSDADAVVSGVVSTTLIYDVNPGCNEFQVSLVNDTGDTCDVWKFSLGSRAGI